MLTKSAWVVVLANVLSSSNLRNAMSFEHRSLQPAGGFLHGNPPVTLAIVIR